ncbi:general substrate transporter [Atractiella rhizophila]|nr:general substrate transporter [Atractiella rhizophila]
MEKRKRLLVGQPLLYLTSCFVSLGVFLFGYDQGVMSGIITGPYFMTYFHTPTHYEIGIMVAILEVGAFITSLLAGLIGDVFGRRRTLFMGAFIFTIGGAIQTVTNGFPMMVFGRIISGFGVGFLSMIVPVYQSEISPAEHRGKLACIEFTGNIVGYASSVWIDYFSSFWASDMSWRFPLAIQCVIGLILALGSLVIPESPRWLLDTDRDITGLKVLADLHGEGDPHHPKARFEFTEIKEKVLADRAAGKRGYVDMWRKYKGRVLLAMSSQGFAQLNGINVISYYAPLVFEQAGWIGRDAILMTGINAVIYVLSTIPPWYLVDRWGRRPILISGGIIMALALGSIGAFIRADQSYTPKAVVGGVIVFNAFFGYSWGPIPWLYPPEIMPLPFRVKGVSLSTATNWLFNFIVGVGTPTLQDKIGWLLYVMHGGFCVASCILVYFLYPETMGVPLEEMDALFGDDSRGDMDETTSLVHSRAGSMDAVHPPDLDEEEIGKAAEREQRKSGGFLGFGRSKRDDYEAVNQDE